MPGSRSSLLLNPRLEATSLAGAETDGFAFSQSLIRLFHSNASLP